MGLFKDEKTNRIILQPWKRDALEKFEAKILDKQKPFPCIPATQGYSLNHLRYGFVGDPRKISSIQELASLLTEFNQASKELGKYTSLILFYETHKEWIRSYSVEQFEQLFWDLLNGLSDMDPFDWPSHIPKDPHNSLWEFCFHKEPYFMYCATPSHARRKSRYFPYFMLAVTPRWVLEEFNATPTLANKIRSQIRKRLENYDSVPAHPNLNSYGHEDNYEWKQYFLHDDDTSLSKCPFHSIKGPDPNDALKR